MNTKIAIALFSLTLVAGHASAQFRKAPAADSASSATAAATAPAPALAFVAAPASVAAPTSIAGPVAAPVASAVKAAPKPKVVAAPKPKAPQPLVVSQASIEYVTKLESIFSDAAHARAPAPK